MPPQQPDRPLDILDDGLSFGAHDRFLPERKVSVPEN
jgi:hypothetical protein